MSAFMDHMEKIGVELHNQASAVHDIAAGLRGITTIARYVLEANPKAAERAAHEIEVLATLLADKASQVATKLEPLEFGKRLKAETGADHE